jgi:hypothetical protein
MPPKKASKKKSTKKGRGGKKSSKKPSTKKRTTTSTLFKDCAAKWKAMSKGEKSNYNRYSDFVSHCAKLASKTKPAAKSKAKPKAKTSSKKTGGKKLIHQLNSWLHEHNTGLRIHNDKLEVYKGDHWSHGTKAERQDRLEAALEEVTLSLRPHLHAYVE